MFQRAYSLLILVLIFTSCRYIVYTNGKYNHKINHSEVSCEPQNDSILVLGSNDKIPDAAVLVNDIKIQYRGLQDLNHSNYNRMVNAAKVEAKRIGANVIKIPFIHSYCWELSVQMYLLKEPFLSEYKERIDSLNQISDELNRDVCIVHMKGLYYPNKGFRRIDAIFFNDSIISYYRGLHEMYQGNIAHEKLDLKFDEEGTLFIINREKPTKKQMVKYKKENGIYLKRGKEYYIYVIGGVSGLGGRPILRIVPKDEYNNTVIY